MRSRIVPAVVKAVGVSVALKICTDWNGDNRNGLNIARIAAPAPISIRAMPRVRHHPT